jgi:urease accessory protein
MPAMMTFTRIAATAVADTPGFAGRVVELVLTRDERARSRHVAVLADGTAVALLLPRGTVLTDGTLLSAEDGRLAVVRAAAQPVLRISAASPLQLLRTVYHLANRHVPMQIGADHALIEPDPVLRRLAQALGATIESVIVPFEPEAGAYQGQGHVHDGSGDPPANATHGLDAEDASAGRIGEMLSIAAHARRAGAGET